jgi:hypothetical protein
MSQVSGGQSQNMAYTPQGASFYGVAPVPSSAQQIVAPAANVNGVVIRLATLKTASGQIALFADTSAPSGPLDVTKRAICSIDNSGYLTQWIRDVFIPAGRGLWVVGNNGSTDFWVTYVIL